MMNFKIIFALLFFSSAYSSVPTTTHADLKEITENFFTLARITNAISLQASVLQKNLNFREVIAEFLRIEEVMFSEIVQLDTKLAISTLKNLDETVRNVLRRNSFTSMTGHEDFLNALERIMDLQKEIKEFEIDPKIKAEDFQLAIEESSQQLTAFGDIFDVNFLNDLDATMDDLSSGTSTDKQASKKFDEISKMLPMVEHCLERIVGFHSVFKKLPIWNVDYNIRLADKIIGEHMPSIEIVARRLIDFKNELEFSEELWKDELKSSLLGNLGQQMHHVLKTHRNRFNLLEPKDPVLTVSYMDPKELRLVSKDLQNPWFKKHFVRDSSLANLSRALEPLVPIAESIEKLVEDWRPFIGLLETESIYKDTLGVSATLITFENFTKAQDSLPSNEVVKNALKMFQGCVFVPENDANTTMEAFKTQLKYELNVVESLSRVEGRLKEFHTEFSIECFKHFRQKFESPDAKNSENLKDVLYSFMSCMAKHREPMSFFDLISNFHSLEESLHMVKDATERLNKKTANVAVPSTSLPAKISFADVLNKNKVLQTVNCLRPKKISLVELEGISGFLENIVNFPVQKHIDYTVAYMEKLMNVQATLKEAELKFNASSNRPRRDAHNLNSSNPVFELKNSRTEAEDFGVCTLSLLNLLQVLDEKEDLLRIGNFSQEVKMELLNYGLHDLVNPKDRIEELLKMAHIASNHSRSLKGKDPLRMAEIFDKVASIDGIDLNRQKLFELKMRNLKNPDFQEAQHHFDTALRYNLHFTTYRRRLLDGRSIVRRLQSFYDQIFEHFVTSTPKEKIVEILPWPALVGIAVGSVFLLIVVGLTLYGCTRRGREKYRSLYIYYFGKTEDFEKRWRYSRFMDKVNGENALLDSVRETNKENMLIAIKRGVYVDAYNNFGNTALHVATKHGHDELVKILICNGADRSLLNAENRTPEQMVPAHFKTTHFDIVDKFERIISIYKKYKNKSFRSRVPEIFPVSSFRIWPEDRTEDGVTNRFLVAFGHIASVETSNRTTHCVMKTDENGILETDSLSLLFWIFHGCIIVREQWMNDCLKNEKLIEQDYNYLVEKVRFKGVVYDTVLQWSNAMAKSELPYLFGVQVAVVMKEYSNMVTLAAIVNAHGGTMLDEFPNKKKYRAGSHPYLHAHLGPLFIIHDGTMDLTAYAKDKMFTFFTEDTFIQFMLKREIYRDTSEEPICVVKDPE